MNVPQLKELFSKLTSAIEEDPRSGLKDTPRRATEAWLELLSGYSTDIPSLFTTFEGEGKDQVVIVKDIRFFSVCEHHLLPFEGLAHIAYLPGERVLGVSKIVRLVDAYSRRLQIQERMGEDIAQSLMTYLHPRGVAVVIEAFHLCMRCRGVKNPSTKVVTSIMLGAYRDDYPLRQETLALLKGG